ncbi:YciI family protein [Rossellomorea sp. SC111]|uniref:YciI family protein n=1 Tax=Rossellomorea sp. SC111 TaxID=2968985 RepID=UPI00215B4EDE|nr:YciI family protein [Rossellomorea sp. SC111]MCR8849503.1 YciI family protein [Rossellomorea sp. SC111]
MEFIYVLKLIPRLYQEENWTAGDEEIVKRHFERLKEWTDNGTVILAGRTLNEEEKAFGIVVFEADDEEQAKAFMKEDPTVTEGIMTAELFPYRVALLRKN